MFVFLLGTECFFLRFLAHFLLLPPSFCFRSLLVAMFFSHVALLASSLPIFFPCFLPRPRLSFCRFLFSSLFLLLALLLSSPPCSFRGRRCKTSHQNIQDRYRGVNLSFSHLLFFSVSLLCLSFLLPSFCRHEMPVEGELSHQNIQDRYHGVNDPVARKILRQADPNYDEKSSSSSSSSSTDGKAGGGNRPSPPTDPAITTLFLGGIEDHVTETEIRLVSSLFFFSFFFLCSFPSASLSLTTTTLFLGGIEDHVTQTEIRWIFCFAYTVSRSLFIFSHAIIMLFACPSFSFTLSFFLDCLLTCVPFCLRLLSPHS